MYLKAWLELRLLWRNGDDVVGLAFLVLLRRPCGGSEEPDTTLWFLSFYLIFCFLLLCKRGLAIPRGEKKRKKKMRRKN